MNQGKTHQRPSVLLVLLAALCLCFASTVSAVAQDTQDPEEPKKEKRVTIGVECGSQGVVDADWSISFDVYKDGQKLNTKGPIEISVPTGTGSGPAAQRMAA